LRARGARDGDLEVLAAAFADLDAGDLVLETRSERAWPATSVSPLTEPGIRLASATASR
jgi:hypothetical protein